jgi:hypothetical protein
MTHVFRCLLLAGVFAAFSFLAPTAASVAGHPAGSATARAEVAPDPNLVIDDPCADPNACVDPDGNAWIDGRFGCAYVPKWALQSVLWTGIFYYGAMSVVGLIADYTVAGLPVGVILGAVGISRGVTLSFAVWWVDNYWGVGRRICA